MNNVQRIYAEERRIESCDVDLQSRIRPQTLLAYMLNSAWNDTEGTPYGYRQLLDNNLMWVLIRMEVIIRRTPLWGERITLETWGKKFDRLYALRDFAVHAASGETIVSATSSWMMLNTTTGRPQRPSQLAFDFLWNPEKEELPTNLAKVPECTHGTLAGRYRVYFSDIDVNRHVNSTRYLVWMLDSHPHHKLEKRELRSMEISYIAEAVLGDEVAVFREEDGSSGLCSVRHSSDGKELCRARLVWDG